MERELPVVKFAKVREGAVVPCKRDEDSGYDIYACIDGPITILPSETVKVPTGLVVVCPEGYWFKIEERGSTGDVGMKKSAGIMDYGFFGEWFIEIFNGSSKPIVIAPVDDCELLKQAEPNATIWPANKAIAQAILQYKIDSRSETIDIEEAKRIEAERGTKRGGGALGSSGK